MDALKLGRKNRLLIWLGRIWVGLSVAFSVWETVTYSGAAAFFGEWQYDKIGSSFPALTCLLMIAFLSLPPLIIARLQKRYSKDRLGRPSTPHDIARAAALRLRNGFIVAALITACAILAIGIFALSLPDNVGPSHLLAVTDIASPPILGPTELRGRVLYDKVAVLNEDAVLSHSRDRFAPIVGEGADQETFRFFVELPSDVPGLGSQKNTYFGILRRRGLPGDLEKLFRYSGYKIPEDYYVLFSSVKSMRREYIDEIIELNIFLIFLVIMQFIFRLRIKRIDRSMVAKDSSAQE